MGDNAGKTLDIEQNAREDEVDKYPLLIRLFGVVSIIGGGLQVVAFALELVALFTGQVDFTTIEEHTATTIVIAGVESVLMVVLAAMFVVLGIRLVRGKRYIAALLCNIMIALEILVLVGSQCSCEAVTE